MVAKTAKHADQASFSVETELKEGLLDKETPATEGSRRGPSVRNK